MINSKIVRTDYKYDIEEVLFDWNKIKAKLQQYDWYQGTQTCLQYSSQCHSKFTEGCGSIRRAEGRTEQDFNLINPLYQDTVFERIINDVGAYRTRIMRKPKHSCYSIHSDKVARYHLPIITNPHALFMFYEGETSTTLHLPADGYVWWTDTTREHTVINAGEERTHMVMCAGQ